MDHSTYASLLSSKQRLERDKGLAAIKEALKDPNGDVIWSLEQTFLELLTKDAWESTHGALMAAGLVIEAGVSSEGFCREIQKEIPGLLEHNEPRVRLAAGEVATLGQFQNSKYLPLTRAETTTNNLV